MGKWDSQMGSIYYLKAKVSAIRGLSNIVILASILQIE